MRRAGRGGEGSAQQGGRWASEHTGMGTEEEFKLKRAWRERRDAGPPRRGREGT